MRTTRPLQTFRRSGLAGLLWLLAAAGNAAAPAALTVVSDDNYPPYIFRDSEGRLQGILPDQWALWAQKTGVKVNLQAMDWLKAQEVMRAGQADVIDTIFRTPEREAVYAFTPPYARIEVPVFAHETLGGITDVNSLHGFTIGVKAGDAVIEHLTNRGISNLQEFPSYESIIQAAKHEELKVFSVDQPAAIYYLYKHGIATEFRRSFVLYTGEFHRAVRKNRPDLLALVNGGFSKITKSEYRAIDRKWMGSPFLLRELLRDWLPVFLLVAAVILLLAGGNVFLQHRVHRRTAELRRALDDLHHSREHLQRLLKVAPVGIGLVKDRKIVEANDAFCKLSGYDPGEILGQSSELFYASPEEFARVGQIFYAQIAGSGHAGLEILGRRKSGALDHWWLNGALLEPACPDAGVIFTVLDITERKKYEEELRVSREYFASIFDAVNDGLMIHDPATGQLLDVNRRFCDMSGYGREEALATGAAPMCAGTPPYSAAEFAEWNRKACTEGPQTCEFLAKHRDGRLLWVEVSLRQVRIGPDLRLIAAVRDIGERKAAEEARRNYERRLQEAQKLESLGLLAGGIAHDFNNLLAAILGNIDLALLALPEDSPAREDIEAAMAVTKRAADLVQQMLAYAGKGRFQVQAVDLAATIRETISLLKTSIPDSLRLDLNLPADLPRIPADAIQLHQVVLNLVLNAVEAHENRTGTIRISAAAADGQKLPATHVWPPDPPPLGPCVVMEIADTGKGMPPDVLNKIFDPFFSTKFTGRGLGLPAVLGIVRRHHGALQVKSVPGQGSAFLVYLPLTARLPDGTTANPAPPAEGARI